MAQLMLDDFFLSSWLDIYYFRPRGACAIMESRLQQTMSDAAYPDLDCHLGIAKSWKLLIIFGLLFTHVCTEVLGLLTECSGSAYHGCGSQNPILSAERILQRVSLIGHSIPGSHDSRPTWKIYSIWFLHRSSQLSR